MYSGIIVEIVTGAIMVIAAITGAIIIINREKAKQRAQTIEQIGRIARRYTNNVMVQFPKMMEESFKPITNMFKTGLE